jgi:hypothetical protein
VVGALALLVEAILALVQRLIDPMRRARVTSTRPEPVTDL